MNEISSYQNQVQPDQSFAKPFQPRTSFAVSPSPKAPTAPTSQESHVATQSSRIQEYLIRLPSKDE
jgi:hypothetical protein